MMQPRPNEDTPSRRQNLIDGRNQSDEGDAALEQAPD
jgi:hypothetical protein